MADVSDEWGRLIPAWDQIVTALLQEAPTAFDMEWRNGAAPETYRLIHQVLAGQSDTTATTPRIGIQTKG